MGMRGGHALHHTAHDDPLIITSMEELEYHLKMMEMPGDKRAVAWMCAYVHEAQLVWKEEHSPLQDAGLLKWKTPSWVSVTKLGDPNAPIRVNTPQLIYLQMNGQGGCGDIQKRWMSALASDVLRMACLCH
jgi:hypothetical protein